MKAQACALAISALVAHAPLASSKPHVRPLSGEVRLDQPGSADEGFYAAVPNIMFDSASDTVVAIWAAPRRDELYNEIGIRGRRFDNSLAPLGDDFLVNTATPARDSIVTQEDAALLSDGRLLVVWTASESFVSEDYDNVVARRFVPPNDPDNTEFALNQARNGQQTDAEVVAGHDGQWLALWQNETFAPSDFSARYQLFDGSERSGAERTLSGPETPVTFAGTAVVDPTGDFFIVWGTPTDQTNRRILGAKLTANGLSTPKPLTPEGEDAASPALAAFPDGRLLVVWRSDGPDFDGIRARVFDSELNPLSVETNVWMDPNPLQVWDKRPGVAMSPSGLHAVVTWGLGDLRSDERDGDVVGQVIDGNAAPVGAPFNLSVTSHDIDERVPSVVYTSPDTFVAAWGSLRDREGIASVVLGRTFEVGALAPLCGDSDGDGFVSTSDALSILRAAVGAGSCELCSCDINSDGATTVRDAFLTLRSSVGLPAVLQCHECGR